MKNLTLSFIILYLIIIFYFSSIPVPKLLKNKPDVLLHFIEYGFLSFLFYIHYTEFFRKKIRVETILFVLIFILLFAISDEYHQSFVPGRYSDIKDVIVDFIGASFIIIFSLFVQKFLFPNQK